MARASRFYIVLLVILTAPVFGLIIGTVAGYFGGWVDQVLMRITDIFLAFPKLILALALVAVLGPGMVNAVLAIALTSWPPYARVARAETLTVRNSDYIAAVRLQGRRGGPHHLGPYHADVPALGHHPRHAGHGRRDPDGGGPWLSWPWRAATDAGMGRDDQRRAQVPL